MFVANYTCSILGRQRIELFFKENLDKSIFDLITVSDEAFVIILVENNMETWIDQAKKEREVKENGFITCQPNGEHFEMRRPNGQSPSRKEKMFSMKATGAVRGKTDTTK